ncbi:MAG: LysM peptidoglycan-binding domain-containing protein [Rubricoccaceae bacterium]
MPRIPLAAASSLLVVAPALAQSTTVAPRPAQPFAATQSAFAAPAAPQDSLSDEQLALRIAHLYSRQAELLQAEAAGQTERYEHLLESLVADLQLLAQQPGAMSRARFREVYSSVLTEYEQYYDRAAMDRGEVYAFRAAALRALFDETTPLLENVPLPDFHRDMARLGTAVPLEVNERIERSIRFLLSRGGHVATLRARADTYFPMIERILAEEGVPDEMKYLAMVESALNPIARSHAGAAGLWQFIPATGGAYGLQVNNVLDDRLDPEKATRAAARHLRDLYDRFGDWHLAMAGYNMNPNRVARYVREFEDRTGRRATYWDIYSRIPQETQGYVPMFIATALVLSNPDAYGLPAPAPGPRYVFDRVPVAGGTSLAQVARAIGVTEEALRALNPSLRAGRVPDVRTPWMLRVPAGTYGQFAEALDAFAPPTAGGLRLAAETVNYGPRANRPLTPLTPSEALLAASGRPPARPAARPAPRQNAPARTPEPPRELARPSVAEAPPVTLAAAEPEAPAAEAALPVRQVADTRPATPTRRAAAPAQPTTHVVQRGENLTQIAARYGLSVQQLAQWNGLDNASQIRAGQRLALRDTGRRAPVRAAAPTPRVQTHTVARGENLTQIARRYGVTVGDIQRWNNLSGSSIRAGQQLRIETGRTVG